MGRKKCISDGDMTGYMYVLACVCELASVDYAECSASVWLPMCEYVWASVCVGVHTCACA